MTCTNVWPAVRVIGLPSGPNRSVGAVAEAFRHVPFTVRPFVRTVRMDGTFGGEWRGGVDEFLARHDYISKE